MTFSRKANMERHKGTAHNGRKIVHKCMYCAGTRHEVAFASSQDLLQHIAEVHPPTSTEFQLINSAFGGAASTYRMSLPQPSDQSFEKIRGNAAIQNQIKDILFRLLRKFDVIKVSMTIIASLVKFDKDGNICDRIAMPLRSRNSTFTPKSLEFLKGIYLSWVNECSTRCEELENVSGSNWSLEAIYSLIINSDVTKTAGR